MNKAEYIASCLYDAISALSVPNLPDSIQIGTEYIYPKIAIERLRSIQTADQLFKDK